MKNYYLMADFAVPLWQRAAIRAKEDIKTVKGVAGDILSGRAWTQPSVNKVYTEGMIGGAKRANQRVKEAIHNQNLRNKAAEQLKNAKYVGEIPAMKSNAKVAYNKYGISALAPKSGTQGDFLNVSSLDKGVKGKVSDIADRRISKTKASELEKAYKRKYGA